MRRRTQTVGDQHVRVSKMHARRGGESCEGVAEERRRGKGFGKVGRGAESRAWASVKIRKRCVILLLLFTLYWNLSIENSALYLSTWKQRRECVNTVVHLVRNDVVGHADRSSRAECRACRKCSLNFCTNDLAFTGCCTPIVGHEGRYRAIIQCFHTFSHVLLD